MDTLFTTIAGWLGSQTLLETIGVITGTLCVYLAAKNKIWNWPVAIISVAIYIVIFFEAKLYADMGLQFYFMATNLYGWYFWSRKSAVGAEVKVRSINQKEILFSLLAIAIFTPLLGFTLLYQTDASFPFIDSFCTACSLVAQFFLARKIVQNWLIWIFVDLIYVVIYLMKGLDLTAVMYMLYIYIATVGYLDWRKMYQKQQQADAA